jgi:regulator of protease activity HflC (stomatin/prohibitin superfamily)
MLSAFSVFVLFVVLFALIFVGIAVKSVPQGHEWTVERFGRYVRTLEPGLALIVPIVDRIGARISMMETVFEVPSQSVITRDNAVATVDAIVFYQVLDAAKAAYEVSNLQVAILNLVMTNIRTVMGSMNLDELLSERDRINTQLLAVVDAATTPWGVKVQRVEIKDIAPPPELVAAMARQMKAEREKRANVLEAEGFKQAAVLKAEGEKQAVILAAEARREAAFRGAEARERQAEAEAKATTSVSEAIGRGSIQAINYFVAQRYIDAIGRLAGTPNQKVILMPLESASMIGSLAGIAEVARESFSASRPAANPAVAGPPEPAGVQPVSR